MVGDPENRIQAFKEALEASQGQEESDQSLEIEEQVIPAQYRRNLRALAFHYLYVADAFGYDITIDQIVDQFAQDYKIRVEGTDFPQSLAAGVIQNREKYSGIIEPLLENWRFDRIGCCTDSFYTWRCGSLSKKMQLLRLLLMKQLNCQKHLQKKMRIVL